ncbi:MAG: type IV pilus secretin PilQ [Bdellovibrionales bacterium]|nr:type IV pilus secretin PilQ [Bdellovibrionales bacterium]
MKNTKWISTGLLALLTSFAWGQTAAPARITAINFRGNSDPSQIEITATGPIEYTIEEDVKGKSVMIEIPNSQLAKGLDQKQDTSAFGTNVLSIQPVQAPGSDVVRVILQLREMARVEIDAKGKTLVASIPSAGDGSDSMVEDPGIAGMDPGLEPPPMQDLPPPGPMAPEMAKPEAPKPLDPKAALIEDFLSASERHEFVGSKITLQMKDADVGDIFRLISEASGFNIILGSDIRGTLTMSLVDVPWDLALDTVFQTLRLGGKRQGSVLRVMTLQAMTNEAQENLRAKQANELNQPRVTRLFPLSYADPATISTTLNAFLAAEQASASAIPGAAAPPVSSASGTVPGALVQVDTRTNSILVRDIPRRVDQMRKLIELMDTQTPQILIEAKIVEANETFGKSLAGAIGGGNLGSGPFGAGFNGIDPVAPIIPTAPVADSGITGQISWSPTVGFINGIQRINAQLTFGERQGSSKNIASPRLVVLNKQQASISQETPILVPGVATGPNGVQVPTLVPQPARLSLQVTPTVTNDGSVLMTLTLSRGVIQNSLVAARDMNTQVLVDSGSTLVLGGIYTQVASENETGMPFLRKIPLIGALFGSESNSMDKNELFFFITPRILNEKEAGLLPKSDQG